MSDEKKDKEEEREARRYKRDIIEFVARRAVVFFIIIYFFICGYKQMIAVASWATTFLVDGLVKSAPAGAQISMLPASLLAIVYFIHLAIPVGFVLVLIRITLAAEQNCTNEQSQQTRKTSSWIWIAGLIGLMLPFVLGGFVGKF